MSKTAQRKRARYQTWFNEGYQDRLHGRAMWWPRWLGKDKDAYVDGYRAAADKVRIHSAALKKRSRWHRFIEWLFMVR